MMPPLSEENTMLIWKKSLEQNIIKQEQETVAQCLFFVLIILRGGKALN